MRDDPDATSPQTLRFVCKPDEEANNHTVMIEADIYRDKIILPVLDPYHSTWKTNTNDILEDTAAKFPHLKMKMGVAFNETQKGMGCMQFSSANAELVPSKALHPLKEAIMKNDKGCLVIEDKVGKFLPLESYLYMQGPPALKDLLKNPDLGTAELREQLWENGANHKVNVGNGKVFINSIASYRLATLRNLLKFLEKMEKEDGAGEKLAAARSATVICPDTSWRKPLEKALAGLHWTPEDETSNLTEEINRISAGKSPQEKGALFQKIAMDFMAAFPHLDSSRLRHKSAKLFEGTLASTPLEKDKAALLRTVDVIFKDNSKQITEKERAWLDKLTKTHASENEESSPVFFM